MHVGQCKFVWRFQIYLWRKIIFFLRLNDWKYLSPSAETRNDEQWHRIQIRISSFFPPLNSLSTQLFKKKKMWIEYTKKWQHLSIMLAPWLSTTASNGVGSNGSRLNLKILWYHTRMVELDFDGCTFLCFIRTKLLCYFLEKQKVPKWNRIIFILNSSTAYICQFNDFGQFN